MGDVAVDPLGLLRRTIPEWFAASGSTGVIEGVAEPGSSGAATSFTCRIMIWRRGDEILASETGADRRLPSFCPDRHIEQGGTFCLGLRYRRIVVDIPSAIVWWNALEAFLRRQRAAARTRRWPDRQWLSHGEAGEWHAKAIGHARELGVADEYDHMVATRGSRLLGPDIRIEGQNGILLNGRAACPIGCKRRGAAILRRNCCRKEHLVGLVEAEWRRRTLEKIAIEAFRASGLQCCGTLDECCIRR